MARPERFELPTTKFVAWCSIQLSYGRRSGIMEELGKCVNDFVTIGLIDT